MASLDQISPEVILKIAGVIGQKLKALGEFSRESYGGVRAVAEMMKAAAMAAAPVLEVDLDPRLRPRPEPAGQRQHFPHRDSDCRYHFSGRVPYRCRDATDPGRPLTAIKRISGFPYLRQLGLECFNRTHGLVGERLHI